jgi:hypothetical protein
MTRKEERRLLEEVHDNNIMLHQICEVINVYLARHRQENEEDFSRNVLANLISSGMDISQMFKRR